MTDRSIHRSEVAEPEPDAPPFSPGMAYGAMVAAVCMVGAAVLVAVGVSLIP